MVLIDCLRLSTALVSYGAPAHRIEDALDSISEVLGIKASYAYSPGMVIGLRQMYIFNHLFVLITLFFPLSKDDGLLCRHGDANK